jgi:DNA-binding LacI/PurR family transcriptional regulator
MVQSSLPSLQAPRPARNAVKRRLLRQIAQDYRAGERLPSVRELARLLQVAPNTAYEAVRELAHEGLIELRPRLGAYVSATAGADPVTREAPLSRPVPRQPDRRPLRVAAHFHLADHFIVDMFESFQARAAELGLVVVPSVNPPRHVVLADDCDLAVLFNQDVRGSVRGRNDQSVVLIETGDEFPEISTPQLDVVSVDQVQGGQVAGRAMRELGLTQAYFVGVGDRRSSNRSMLRETCVQRLIGFERGLGAQVRPEHRSYQQSYGIPPGMLAASEYAALPNRPRGVFCASDELAMGFVTRAVKLGLRPGVDFQLIGFDGQARSETMLGHSIASVMVPARDMGQRAAELLADRVHRPDQPSRRLLLGCRLRPGSTLDPSGASITSSEPSSFTSPAHGVES